ncbi:dermonecrotic toxin domain-containing protein [Pseudomonas faucium]|uniref:dermonecrotic toxin domain-containing protein n=1 Tax=Pseudomonas faucium TaxID=2740518 RepID=UPI001F16C6FD|nr:DUF6543 domain-containing protein [Pseudomonas faucium]
MPTPAVNARGTQFVRNHLQRFPRPDRQAATAIGDWYRQQGLDIDPDQTDVVTLHYRGHKAMIVARQSLTQAVLSNWQGESDNNLIGALIGEPWAGTFPNGPLTIVPTLPAPGLLHEGAAFSVFNGLFRRTDPERFDASTHIPVQAEALQAFIWNMDFHTRYKASLDDYWGQHLQEHRLAAKINFIAACNQQVAQGSLSEGGRRLAWQAAGLMTQTDVIRTRALNIYGYAATDLLCIRSQGTPLTLLYVPGNSAPLHEFASHEALQDWLGKQCQSAEKRQQLRQHFALADLPDGLDFTGLDSALEGLGAYPQVHHLPPDRSGFTTDGRWPPREYVNYRPGKYSPTLTGDLFLALSERQRARSYQDADFLITRNSEVSEARWRGYLFSAMNLLAPLALVVPELAPVFALGGVALFGLGLDQAINGKSQEARAQGVTVAEFGAFNALPLAASAAAEVDAVFRTKGQNFLLPQWVNEQWGYPLSPLFPPKLPDTDVADFFQLSDTVEPLPQGDPAIASAVIRVPRFTGGADELQASISGYNTDVVYDMASDAFVPESELNEVEPTHYIAQQGRRDLVALPPGGRPVSDSMRMSSLRAMGVDIRLPFDPATLTSEGLAPVPRKITCIWLGDQPIGPQLLANLEANAQRLAGSGFELRLLLSNSTPAAFADNLAAVTAQVPGLEVLPLEEQPFFTSFKASKYHAQYQAALEGNGGVARNYASACDVLRYRLLHQEGGFYMDLDDVLLTPGEPIDDLELAASPKGLVLHPPMSNEQMDMRCDFNNSMIGSHAGNPTLDAISELMHKRYQANQDFYLSKPDFEQDPAAFNRYTRRLSYLTGPRLLTDVIDEHLPDMYQLRQLLNLVGIPKVNLAEVIDTRSVAQALRSRTPLNRIAKVGATHSWKHT